MMFLEAGNQAAISMLASITEFLISRIDYEPVHTLECLSDDLIKFCEQSLFTDEKTSCDLSDFGDICKLAVALNVVERVYAEAIETNMHYKDAYKLAKERVNAYAAVVGKSQILMLTQD